MIPDFIARGELPPGEHPATLNQIELRYATNPIRRAQYEGLVRACSALAAAGATTVWLNGSYITAKTEPGDYDATFDTDNLDWIALGLDEPELLDFDAPRSTQKRTYGGELIPNVPGGVNFVDFFQHDRNGNRKGIIRIDLGDMT